PLAVVAERTVSLRLPSPPRAAAVRRHRAHHRSGPGLHARCPAAPVLDPEPGVPEPRGLRGAKGNVAAGGPVHGARLRWEIHRRAPAGGAGRLPHPLATAPALAAHPLAVALPAPRAGGLASGLRLEPPARPRLPALPVAGTRGRGGTRTAATVHPRSAAHPGRAPHAAAPGGPAGPCL